MHALPTFPLFPRDACIGASADSTWEKSADRALVCVCACVFVIVLVLVLALLVESSRMSFFYTISDASIALTCCFCSIHLPISRISESEQYFESNRMRGSIVLKATNAVVNDEMAISL